MSLPFQDERAEPPVPNRFMVMTEVSDPFGSGAWLHQATRQSDTQMGRGDRGWHANAASEAA